MAEGTGGRVTEVGDDRQWSREKGLGGGLSYNPVAATRGAKLIRHLELR